MSGFSLRGNRELPWAAVAGAIVLLLAGLFAAFYEEALYQSQRAQGGLEQAQVLAASVPAALSFGDRKAAEEYVRPMQVNPEIAAAGLYHRDGDLLTGFSRAHSDPLPPRLNGAKHLADDGAIVVPVVQSGTPLGWVYLGLSAEPRANRISRYAVVALLAFMAVFVIMGLGNAQTQLKRQSQRLSEANLRLENEIAERERIEEALRQSQKMEALGQLSGGIAHDLNNHLMIIKGNLHLLKKKIGLPGEDRHVQGADEGIRRAAALTQRVLSFSRKQALSPVEVDLNELIGDMGDLIRNSLRENISIERHLQSTQRVQVDRNQMENIVLNIVVNARDALPGAGKVTIATRDAVLDESGAPGSFVVLEITDTGIGMAPEVLARAFDPFFTTKPVGQGTGLGLSTAYGFVTQSGGHMRIKSSPGAGATITIFLPALPGDEVGCG
ncbi:MAG: hybrid sensor histidine kinase/response regulator [Alphaproteobacteria bacterium]|nr:hybrid sensor histidine kinase/response regulator [Alphaproteobacteria bacterium]MBV9694081.1 hybrid sensor histidine kinase/response regulator [Alphaproteobacteria bacterium]